MRRETDFVLEKAAWPTMLLEAGGRICRANQAARRIFGLPENLFDTPLTSFWDEENNSTAATFLQEQSRFETAPLKLRLQSGKKSEFIAHVAKVVREGQDYYVLQLFKESGGSFIEPASAIVLPESKGQSAELAAKEKEAGEDFLLENVEWPALVVHKVGRIEKANRAAVRAFGGSVQSEGAQFDALWSPRNRGTSQEFLNLPPLPGPAPLFFNLKSGLLGEFWVQSGPTNQDDIFLLQLLKEPAAKPGAPAPSVSAPAPVPVAAVSAAQTAAAEGAAHKQKLDCALQLARSVALDFNNALTSILGHTSLLLSKAEPGHPWQSSLTEIEKSAAKAAEIANDLAAFSRQEKDARVQVAGNLNTLVERTIEAFQSSLNPSITISRELERKLFTAVFDEAKMQQALVKIFENAVEAIKGQGKISVQTRNLELTESTQDRTARLSPGNYVCVEIADTGSGIAEDVLPRVFEPFFSTKGARHRGLGLAWVYGIVTNHGGGVAVSSQPEMGTTVRVYLPASRKIVKDAPLAVGDLTGSQTILFVDDEDLLLTMGQMVLSSYGYTVLTANSGQKALELFSRSKKKIDLVITDLVMPNMSGRELSEQILKLAQDTKIIWSSGYVRSTNSQEQERYLQKPFSAQDLLRKVKQVLVQ